MSQVADRIERLIAEGGLQPGARLPAERRLAIDLGISRSRLREAIQHLASRGILRSRQGGGTFVAKAGGTSPVEQALQPIASLARTDAGFWQDVMEIRKSLDADAAYFAALRATPADKDRLAQILAAVIEAEGGDPHRQARADAALHMAIAEASHNMILRQIMLGLHAVLEASISESRVQLYRLAGTADVLESQHRDIVAAIIAGRADDARKAARRHLDFVEQNLRRIEEQAARQRRATRMLADLVRSRKDSPS